MRRTWTLLGFVIFVFLAGALISPWIYRVVQGAAGHNGALAELADKPFPRFVSRTLLVLAIVGLWPLLALLRFSWRDVGLTPPDWRNFGRGALLGFVMLGAFLGLELVAQAREWRSSVTVAKVVWSILTASGTAALVAFVEEIIFRGAIFGTLRRESGWITALLASSVLFAFVHFLQSPRAGGDVHWLSGFDTLGQMFALGSHAQNRAAQLINFTLCGILLALAYQRTGNLWFSIGLHGGWIFWLKLGNQITRVSPDAPEWFWGTRKVLDGCVATVLLFITLAALPSLLRKSASHLPNAIPDSRQPQNVG